MAITRYNHLGFFGKDGTDLNFYYDAETGIWVGSINLPEVSVGLYETANIFISEEFIDGVYKKWGIPHYSDPNIANINGPIINIRWENDKTPEIFLYEFDKNIDRPSIEIIENLEISIDFDLTQTNDIITGQVITSSITDAAVQLNIAINTTTEDIFERYLIIEEKFTGNIIAKILFHAESIGEDDRLAIELMRTGLLDINSEEYRIFIDSDINEDAPDFTILNSKRKEMLIEGRNIKPFIGSYKGIINAIKFYGYNNIKLREYWLNIDSNSPNYGKYKSTPVLDIFDSTVNLNDETYKLPTNTLKKTSLFSLVYRLNQITDKLNGEDLPITTETSDFTFEEVLIKLYGLKEILRKKYLIGSSRIIDIIGEADYFSKKKLATFNISNKISKINCGIKPKMTSTSISGGYIVDLRELISLTFPSATPYLLDPAMPLDSPIILSTISEVLLGYFKDYSPNLNTVAMLPDKPGIPCGAPFVFENKSFDITVDEATITWDELRSTGSLIFDFTPSSFNSGDTFIIKDIISFEEISYVVQFGDTVSDVVNGLYNNLLIAAGTADGRPWSYYDITIQDIDNDTNIDTVRLRQIFNGNINTELYGFAIDGGALGNNPKLERRFVTGNNLNTWDTFGIGNFYEIEWIIRKEATTTPAYYLQVRGDIGTYNKLPVALPYVGKYSVELRLYDTFNQMSSIINNDYVEVLSKNVEFIGFYKFKEKEYTWDSVNITWDEYTAMWDLPIVPVSINDQGLASVYEALDRANYILNNSNQDQTLSYHYNDPNNPILNESYTPGPYTWDNLGDCTWDEAYHLWWDSTKVSGDTPASFRIYDVAVGGILTITQTLPNINTGLHIFTTSDLLTAANELNSNTDAVISKYVYNKVLESTTGGDSVVFIQGVAKLNGKNGDWETISATPNVNLKFPQLSETNNPTFIDTRFLTDGLTLPKLVHLTFTYDMCKIPGKTNSVWHLINLDSTPDDDIYFTGRWFTYLFKRIGRYSLELQLEDSNGNINSITKNILIIK